ncbi:Superfamily II DNA and RNA helicase [Granulibacter bethesdensis]|uniref:Superfamily II DNA and RNA helicase n=1 Tax=Granulibacter bethesdensis (strain ATCC BAA-1260 / CGDNIH1) TaxID=391165 RepID=Q0BV82_GRABC|nr:Superfamily II DNA and RNA helicase [Granulibacter bethesdensis CGDNIH1]APG30592.1 Superfamily II DNA and RNA helicase [Granulibacter bethesdensis]APH51056.1 Superfamily II DNA and RNA helicase [Granulibacter bethesdensis]APH63750.1 Superfamily II DNA and RNA helicase [Granulibacter bethesdensis]
MACHRKFVVDEVHEMGEPYIAEELAALLKMDLISSPFLRDGISTRKMKGRVPP